MGPKRWHRKRNVDTGTLEQAQRSLEHAMSQRAEQDRKREHEQEGVIKRMEQLAEGNHLAALVWDVITGGNGQ